MKKKQNQKKQFSKSFTPKHQKTYDSPYSMDSDYKTDRELSSQDAQM